MPSPFAQFARDQEILIARHAAYLAIEGPSVGDYVRFRDGVIRRVSYVWWDGGIQTSRGGSFYLGEGFANFSGSLYRSVKDSTLTLSKDRIPGEFWFFHHNWPEAGNGVTFSVECRVWDCSEDAPW